MKVALRPKRGTTWRLYCPDSGESVWVADSLPDLDSRRFSELLTTLMSANQGPRASFFVDAHACWTDNIIHHRLNIFSIALDLT